MTVLIVEPRKTPYEKEIRSDLKEMQAIVGGPIQAVYPFEEPVALICNEEGKLQGLPLNRALYEPEHGQLYDIIAGTFFLCGAPPDGENFTSLTGEQAEKYRKRFQRPELFLKVDSGIFALPN